MINIFLAIPAIVWLLISAGFYIFGEYFSKRWGMHPNLITALAVAIFSFLSALFWLPALIHRNQLAIMGTIWLLLATIATVFVGVIVFQEKITPIEWVGIIMALVALAFLGFYNPK